MRKGNCFIFDIDGTLADHTNIRSPFDETKVSLDRLIAPVAIVLNAIKRDGWPIIFVSGRTEGCRKDTESWIKKEVMGIKTTWGKLRNPIVLHMRQKGDHRNDAIVKKEIYDNLILPNFNIVGVFDDRMRVCRMLYDNNIFCFNVNQGLIEF